TTLFRRASPGCSSTLTFTTRSDCSRARATSSSTGAIARQGPHHSAQKSTSTGLSAASTCSWNEVSLAWITAELLIGMLLGIGRCGLQPDIGPGTVISNEVRLWVHARAA